MLSLETLQEDIDNLTKSVKLKQDEAETASQQGNDEGLSIALTSLARINSGLGRRAAIAKYIARNSHRLYEKKKEEKDVLRSKLTLEYSVNQAVGKSEHQAKVDAMKMIGEIDDAFSLYSEAKLVADQAEDLAFRTDTFLRLAQSRLSLLKSDKHGN